MTMTVGGTSGLVFPDNSTQNTAATGFGLQQRFLEAFDYCDGKLFWKINTNKSKNLIGKEAGCKTSGAYGTVNLDKNAYCIHRVIYCMHTGEWPTVVDHINGDYTNHAIENLRAANHSTNNMNKAAQANNTSGAKNVCWSKTHNKWAVQLQKNGKRVVSKLIEDFELACLVAEEARNKFHGKFANHGVFA